MALHQEEELLDYIDSIHLLLESLEA